MSDNSTTVQLKHPIKSHKGDVSSIDIREPTAGSFVRHGEPCKVRMNGEQFELDFNDKATMGFLADCTDHDEIVLSSLKASDYMALRNALARLILGLAGADFTKPSVAA